MIHKRFGKKKHKLEIENNTHVFEQIILFELTSCC